MGKGSNVYRPDTWHAAPRHFLQRKDEKRMVGSFGYIARHPELTLIGFILGETTTTE